MVANPQQTPFMSEADYLVFERASDVRHEYYDGEVWAMASASREHNLICTNIVRVLGNQLLERPCEIYQSDMRVKIQISTVYTYPDIAIACGDPQFTDETVDILLNPTLLIEVLSPSTERHDRGEKFHHYRQIKSLREYCLISQDKARVEVYQLAAENKWLLTEANGLHNNIALASLDCTLSLAEVYRRVAFED